MPKQRKKIKSKKPKQTKVRAKSKAVSAPAPASPLHPELKLQRKPASLDHEILPRTLDSAAFVPVMVRTKVTAAYKQRKRTWMRLPFLTLAVFGIALGSVAMFAPVTSLFNDTEASAGSHETGILDIELDKENWDPDKKLKPGDETQREIEVEQEGTLDFVYEPTVEITGGSDNFCGALLLTAYLGDQQLYQGPLADLMIPEPIASQHNETEWNFVVRLPAQLDNFDDKKCEFNFVFTAWQGELTPATGFTDMETVENEIRSAKKDKKDKKDKDEDDNHHHNNDINGQGVNFQDFLPELPDLPDLPELPGLPELPELPEVPKPDTEQIEEVLEQQELVEETIET